MSRLLLLLPLLLTVACTQGDDGGDTDATGADDTDSTSSDDGATVDDDTDDAVTVDDTDAAGSALAASWAGTWAFTFRYSVQDFSYPGPGQRWTTVDSSCNMGNITLTVSADGKIRVPAPYGGCTQGVQTGWTHAVIDADVSDDGTYTISGIALFGTIGAAGFSSGMGLDVQGTVLADGENPLGLMRISGSRSQNQMEPTENLSFSATLRPVAASAR